jgi:DNA invertase Pin-like site-specific DNA recombinase
MTHSNTTTQQLTEGTRSKWAIIFARARVVPPNPIQEFGQLRVQRQACRAVAEGLGAGVVATYETCGGTTEAIVRGATQQLLRQVEGGGIDFVIVQSWDRLARRPRELAQIVQRLAAAGTRLVTTADPREGLLQEVSLFCRKHSRLA